MALRWQRLCFIVRPYSGVMSSGSPGTVRKLRFWMRIAKKRNTSCRAMTSPMQRRFPMPKTIIFSPSNLLISVPSALRKRSGLKEDGSFHSSLKCAEKGGIRYAAQKKHGSTKVQRSIINWRFNCIQLGQFGCRK